MMQDPKINLILPDEINIALKYKYIPMEEVIRAQANKPYIQHVILADREARPELIDITDTVAETKEIKTRLQGRNPREAVCRIVMKSRHRFSEGEINVVYRTIEECRDLWHFLSIRSSRY